MDSLLKSSILFNMACWCYWKDKKTIIGASTKLQDRGGKNLLGGSQKHFDSKQISATSGFSSHLQCRYSVVASTLLTFFPRLSES